MNEQLIDILVEKRNRIEMAARGKYSKDQLQEIEKIDEELVRLAGK